MKSFVIGAALFAGVTVAQTASDLSSLPPCGVRIPLLTTSIDLTICWRPCSKHASKTCWPWPPALAAQMARLMSFASAPSRPLWAVFTTAQSSLARRAPTPTPSLPTAPTTARVGPWKSPQLFWNCWHRFLDALSSSSTSATTVTATSSAGTATVIVATGGAGASSANSTSTVTDAGAAGALQTGASNSTTGAGGSNSTVAGGAGGMNGTAGGNGTSNGTTPVPVTTTDSTGATITSTVRSTLFQCNPCRAELIPHLVFVNQCHWIQHRIELQGS